MKITGTPVHETLDLENPLTFHPLKLKKRNEMLEDRKSIYCKEIPHDEYDGEESFREVVREINKEGEDISMYVFRHPKEKMSEYESLVIDISFLKQTGIIYPPFNDTVYVRGEKFYNKKALKNICKIYDKYVRLRTDNKWMMAKINDNYDYDIVYTPEWEAANDRRS